jgi:nucleotide-binding universal stress UspA family protein
MNPEVGRILFPTDLSANAQQAFAFAVALAKRFDARITLFHVIEDLSPSASSLIVDYLGADGLEKVRKRRETEFLDTVKARMAEYCEQMTAQAPECERLVDEMLAGHGHAAEEILRKVAEGRFDLVVMGTHGAGGLAEALLGSTARRVVRRSDKPVLTVPLPKD